MFNIKQVEVPQTIISFIMAEPELLSLLEKASNPLTQLKIDIELKGVFAPVEQWKITDEANPNIFSYNIQLLGKQFEKGKIIPRQLTEKEIREAEQAKAKKGGKKDSKVEEPPKQSAEQEQEEARKKAQWQAMTEQQRFYLKNEDPYQAFSLKFQKNTVSIELNKQQIDKLEQDIESGSLEIILTRKPDISEDEVNKLKKAKPKGLNLGELTKITFKGKLDIKSLLNPGESQSVTRTKLVQVEQSLPADAPKFQMKDCYAYVILKLSPGLVPLVRQIKPEPSQLFVLPQRSSSGNLNDLIRKFKGQIITALKSVSAQYSNMFTKDKDYDDKKQSQTNHYSQIKISQVSKRKEIFLNEFKNNGKFALLRQRMEKIIRAICIDKFTKEKGLTKPKPQVIQKALSELSVYFNQQISATINDFVNKKPQQIHEDLLLSHRLSRQSQNQTISPIVNESIEDRCIRISIQYEIINNLQEAEENLQNLTLLNTQSDGHLIIYINFCLRHKKFDTAQILLQKILKINNSLDQRLLLAVLLLRRGRWKQSLSSLKSLLEDPKATNNQKIIYNQLASVVLQKQNQAKQSDKYRNMAEKLFKLKLNLPVKLDEQEDPYQEPRPKIPKPARIASILTPQQSEELNSGLLQFLAEHNFFDLVQQLLYLISDSPKKTLWMAQAALFRQDYSKALTCIQQLLETNNKNYDWLMIKADICYLSQRLFQSQEVLLKVIKLKPNAPKTFALYLRLGNVYLVRKAWEDAKNIFLKACELKSNSSLSWLGLGKAHLNLKQYAKAEQALNLANIYEPFNKQIEDCLMEVRKGFDKQRGQVQSDKSLA